MTLSYCIRPFLMTKIGKSNRRYKRTLKTQRILGGFLAVEVPAGKQQLTFAYHPRMIYLGTAVSGTILLGTAGYLGFKNTVENVRRPLMTNQKKFLNGLIRWLP